MKAYKCADGKVRMFRPDQNVDRLLMSSARSVMPVSELHIVYIKLYILYILKYIFYILCIAYVANNNNIAQSKMRKKTS